MLRKHAYAHCFAYNQRIYSIGGFFDEEDCGGEETITNNCEFYDSNSDSWEELEKMPEARGLFNFALYNNFCYVFGGYSLLNKKNI